MDSMNFFLKIVIIFISFLTLASCDPFQGLLKVQKNFHIISTEKTSGCNGETGWDCDKKVSISIPAGSFESKIDFVNRDQLKITVKVDGVKKIINIPLSYGMQPPPNNGSFHWSPDQIGQSFSVQGTVQTTQSDSKTYRGYEQCSYTRNEYRCENNGHGGQVCNWVPVNYYGQQYVEYFNRVTHQSLQTNFTDISDSYAQFQGDRNFTEKIYLQKGACH